MRSTRAWGVVVCWLIAACTNSTTSAVSYSAFKERLDAGASCEELFTLRSSFGPSSADIPRINEDLRGIGCFSSSSVRSAEPASPDETKSNEAQNAGGFTVTEYRMYRAIIDTPMGVPESQALRRVSQQYRVPVEEVREAVDKVQRALFGNKWFGTPESEIRHASDWNGETR